MYIMARGGGPEFKAIAAWEFESAEELWANKTVQLRIGAPRYDSKPTPRTFEEFSSLLESGERIMLGWNILRIWKCTGCKPADECEWCRLIKETAGNTTSFEREVLAMGGHIINDSGGLLS